MAVNPIPDGYRTITPYIVVDGADSAIALYEKALGAVLLDRAVTPEGKVMNAQLKIGDSMLMLNDEFPDYNTLGPNKVGGSSVSIFLYLDNIDEAFQRAVDAGFEVTMPLEDQFWGDRFGALKDPFGHKWMMGMRIIEDPTA